MNFGRNGPFYQTGPSWDHPATRAHPGTKCSDQLFGIITKCPVAILAQAILASGALAEQMLIGRFYNAMLWKEDDMIFGFSSSKATSSLSTSAGGRTALHYAVVVCDMLLNMRAFESRSLVFRLGPGRTNMSVPSRRARSRTSWHGPRLAMTPSAGMRTSARP